MNDALDWIQTQAEPMLERVERWSAINSGSESVAGLDAMRRALREEFAPLAALEELDLGDGRFALRARMRPEARTQILLGGHYDTVFGPEHPFQHPRREGDDLLRGPGVADMKGGLCVLLVALTAFERAAGPACPLGWTVLMNPDEEIGSPRSRALWAEEAKRHRRGLLFEPALPGGKLVRSRKGSGNFAVTVRGRAAHAGRDPHLGRNAIRALADFICAIDSFNGQRDGVIVNVGRIEGGGAVNIVPDHAAARYNVRTVALDDEEWINDGVADIVAELSARDGIHVEVKGEFASPPKPASDESDAMIADLQACGRELGLELGAGDTGGACDGNKLAAAGLANVDNLGPRGGGLHSSDEHLVISSLVERARLAARYLFHLAQNPPQP